MRDLSNVVWLSTNAISKQLDMIAACSWAAPASAAFESFPENIIMAPLRLSSSQLWKVAGHVQYSTFRPLWL